MLAGQILHTPFYEVTFFHDESDISCVLNPKIGI